MTTLNRIHALGAPDPALSTRFFCFFPDVGEDIYMALALKVQATFPKVPAKSRHTHGSVRYFPDNNEIDGLSITFYETYDFKVTKWLSRWRGLIVHEDGSYGVPTDYQKDIVVQCFLPGSDSPAMVFTYKECWPTDQNPFDLQYEDENGHLLIDAQFSTNKVEMKTS